MSDVCRRDIVSGAAAGLLVAGAETAFAKPPPSQPSPNILWLVSEDNNPLIGAYGDRLAYTPNIDALAHGGLLYRHVYSNAPVCAPSRFSLLTGVYPESCAPAQHMRAIARLPEFIKGYPEHLHAAGYYCTNNAKTDYNCDLDPAHVWDDSSASAHWKNRPPGKIGRAHV